MDAFLKRVYKNNACLRFFSIPLEESLLNCARLDGTDKFGLSLLNDALFVLQG